MAGHDGAHLDGSEEIEMHKYTRHLAMSVTFLLLFPVVDTKLIGFSDLPPFSYLASCVEFRVTDDEGTTADLHDGCRGMNVSVALIRLSICTEQVLHMAV